MDRRELVLKKLHELPDEEVVEAIKNLTRHVQARLRFGSYYDRTKTGAFSEQVLGINAIGFFVGESVKRLFDPNGWDWKFDERSLSQQLTRIASKLISDQVAKYKREKELVATVDKDVGEFYDLPDEESNDGDWYEKANDKIISFALEITQDDEMLFYFTTLYFDRFKFKDIAEELDISIDEVYILRRKLVRRLIKHKEELIDDGDL